MQSPRFTHSLEHGAVVMLYDPCVLESPRLAENLRTLNRTVRECLRRHVITPYKGMRQPFALVTYGCVLLMDTVSEDMASLFITNTAFKVHLLNFLISTSPKPSFKKKWRVLVLLV